MAASVNKDWLCVGKIGAVSGVKGFLKLWSYTEPLDNILSYDALYFENNGDYKLANVSEIKYSGDKLLIQLDDTQDRELARQYTGRLMYVPVSHLAPLDDGDFYWAELEGMQVENTDGYRLGKVDSLFETGSNDVMVVKANDNDAFGKKERLIPYLIDQVVKSVDKHANRIVVDWSPEF